MDVSIISKLNEASIYKNNSVKVLPNENNNASFESMFQSAVSMLNETNDLTNAASEEEMRYALGLSTNTHDLRAVQSKANSALQYTVAVRNTLLDAYRELINLQF